MGCFRNSVGFHLDTNDVTMELKRRIPGCYAFAGLDHGKDFIEQAKLFMEQGFDGIKMLGLTIVETLLPPIQKFLDLLSQLPFVSFLL